MECTLRNHSHTLTRLAAAAMIPGTIVQEAGLAGVVMGAGTIPAGENYEVAIDVLGDVASASATTFAEGAEVWWDNTAKLAVAAASGDFYLGVADVAKVNGDTTVSVVFNRFTYDNITAMITP